MTPHNPNHYIPVFPSQQHQLVIGGIPLNRLAQRVGSTPFYAYDRQAIDQRLATLRLAMPHDLRIHYAMKANPMPALVQYMASLVDGFDLASGGELKVALDTPMPTQHISMAGPGKRPAELWQAIAAGITLHVESAQELSRIAAIAETTGIQARVGIRVNPAFELKTSGMKMGGGAKPFGIDEEQVPAVLQSMKTMNLVFEGFHIYSGSQNLSANAIGEAQRKSIQLAIQLADHCPSPLAKLNIGGGFGIPYFPGDVPLDIVQIGEMLADSMDLLLAAQPQTQVVVELGRYLVGEAGVYVCKVIDKKVSRGQTFLVVDGGLHHHLAASGNFGQVLRKNYPVAIGNKIGLTDMETVTVVGPLCTPLDILADKMVLPKADINDYVVVYQSGAYGYTASPTQFLSQPGCVEVLVG
jgi:diaminopimelate decarboxylase